MNKTSYTQEQNEEFTRRWMDAYWTGGPRVGLVDTDGIEAAEGSDWRIGPSAESVKNHTLDFNLSVNVEALRDDIRTQLHRGCAVDNENESAEAMFIAAIISAGMSVDEMISALEVSP